jgi:hypothetical protein
VKRTSLAIVIVWLKTSALAGGGGANTWPDATPTGAAFSWVHATPS